MIPNITLLLFSSVCIYLLFQFKISFSFNKSFKSKLNNFIITYILLIYIQLLFIYLYYKLNIIQFLSMYKSVISV